MKIASPLTRLVVMLALCLGAAACSSGQNVPANDVGATPANGPRPTSSTKVVVLQNYGFSPSVVTIKAGQTIEWIWRDFDIPDNVTFANFHSPSMTSGTYYHTFTKPGTYPYSSTLHYTMTGEVIVTPDSLSG